MKTTKRILALLMAMTLVIALGATAFAAEEKFTLSLTAGPDSPAAGHTYGIYQIFTGDLSDGILANVKYGANYHPQTKPVLDEDGQPVLDAENKPTYERYATGDLVPQADLKAIETANDAKAFAAEVVASGLVDKYATKTGAFSMEVPAGYYLIIDETAQEDLPEGETLSQYIVTVVENVNLIPKSDTTHIDKKLDAGDKLTCTEDHEHTADCYDVDWQVNGYQMIGEHENFKIETNVISNAGEYKSFYLVVGDTLSKGLTLDTDSFKVTADGVELEEDKGYTLNLAPTSGRTFEIALIDAAQFAGQDIVITYSALVNADAIIGVEGNPNAASVKYTNNPYNDTEDEDGDGYPDDETEWVSGETPDSTTKTFVTGIEIFKVDDKGNALKGAEFTITGETESATLLYSEEFIADDEGTYYALNTDPVSYTLVAPTKDRYVEKDAGDRDGGYVKNADGTYSEATKEQMEDETVVLYKYIEGTEDQYVAPGTDGKYTMYKKNAGWKPVSGTLDSFKAVLTVGDDGTVVLDGLAAGTYTIEETVVPAGYNAIEPMTLIIDWAAPEADDTKQECTWTATLDGADLGKTIEAETANGKKVAVFKLVIENNIGTLLPETGGIGTTIFYVVGGIMLVGAGVLLITKKRMSHAE